LLDAIRRVEDGSFDITFEKAGFIYHTAGLSKPADSYKGNEVFVVGRERILQLLGIEEEPPEAPAGPAAPTAPPAPPPPAPTKPEVKAAPSAEPPATKPPAPSPPKAAPPPQVTSDVVSVPGAPTPAVTPYGLRLPLGKNTDNGKPVF